MTSAGLRHLWKHRRLSLIAFVAAVCIALFFVLRLTMSTLYWSDPDHLQQQPERWMTPGYVARSWKIDPTGVAAVLGLDPQKPQRGRTLEDIAAERGVPVETVIADLAAYLASLRP